MVARPSDAVQKWTGISSSAHIDEFSPDADGPTLRPCDVPCALLWGEETDLWRWVPTDLAGDGPTERGAS